MAIKIYKPTTPSRRNMTGYSFEEITKETPERSLDRDHEKNMPAEISLAESQSAIKVVVKTAVYPHC